MPDAQLAVGEAAVHGQLERSEKRALRWRAAAYGSEPSERPVHPATGQLQFIAVFGKSSSPDEAAVVGMNRPAGMNQHWSVETFDKLSRRTGILGSEAEHGQPLLDSHCLLFRIHHAVLGERHRT